MKEEFNRFVSDFYLKNRKPTFFGICRLQFGQKSGKVLSVSYPVVNWNENFGSFAVFSCASGVEQVANELIFDITPCFVIKSLELFSPFIGETVSCPSSHKNVHVLLELKKALDDGYLIDEGRSRYQLVAFFEDQKTASLQVAYAKLCALSLGMAPLRSLNLDGIFGLLDNVAWSGLTPYELDWLRENEVSLKMRGMYPEIDFVDKFPRYLMHIVPGFDNIRLLDTSKARFGAYLPPGYTQMPGASYVNFNSGATGACMNEGRISSSVIVGEGTDIGGGASILGVLSGGNNLPVSIGRYCLLGANSVTGISLGDGCIVDAGVSVLAGTIFNISEEETRKIAEANPQFTSNSKGFYKGSELSGLSGLHFRVDSRSGVSFVFFSRARIKLNSSLH